MTVPVPVPVLLVTGFLGAGKTTLVNRMLAEAGGRRIAAVVNDFGAVNIDAELIAGASEGIVSLKNGCICCSLGGDLLRTLAALLRREPRPEHIVIETSGVADPADIVRNLMDPVVWREAPLETVLCVVDGAGAPGMFEDALLRSQVGAADLVLLSKTDLVGEGEVARVREAVGAVKRGVTVVDGGAALPVSLLFPDDPDRPVRDVPRPGPVAEGYETFLWTSERPVTLAGLQRAVGRLAPRLVRAKGFFETVEDPGRQMLLQLAGGRAAVGASGVRPDGAKLVRLVFIARVGALSPRELDRAMEECLP